MGTGERFFPSGGADLQTYEYPGHSYELGSTGRSDRTDCVYLTLKCCGGSRSATRPAAPGIVSGRKAGCDGGRAGRPGITPTEPWGRSDHRAKE